MRNHVQAKARDTLGFGCVLCSSVRIGDTWESLPYFHGERAFLDHIQEVHVGGGRWPEGHVKDRAGCVVSKGYPDDDTWDLLLLDWDGISSPQAPSRSPIPELELRHGADVNDHKKSGLVHEVDDVGRLDLNPETSS